MSAEAFQASSQASAPVRSYITWAASIVPGEPHISSRVGLSAFASIAARSCSLLLDRGREPVRDEQDPRLAVQERRHRPVDELREVGARAVRVRQARGDVPPPSPELGHAELLELVERPDDAGRSEVERRDVWQRPVLEILRVGRPQLVLVERVLRPGDDRLDRPPGDALVPGRAGERLVSRRIEEQRVPVAHAGSGDCGNRHDRASCVARGAAIPSSPMGTLPAPGPSVACWPPPLRRRAVRVVTRRRARPAPATRSPASILNSCTNATAMGRSSRSGARSYDSATAMPRSRNEADPYAHPCRVCGQHLAAEEVVDASDVERSRKRPTPPRAADRRDLRHAAGRRGQVVTAAPTVAAAVSISAATSAGCETIATWLEVSSVVVAPMRPANSR